MYKKLLVVSTPRSGTAWYTRVLRQQGIEVGHEKVGPDGSVSGFFFGAHDWYPYKHEYNGERRQDYLFEEVKLLVRNPLSTIPSLSVLLSYSDNVPARKWYADFFGIDMPTAGDHEKLIKASTEVWVKTMQFVLSNEDLAEVLRFEDLLEIHGDVPRPNGTFVKAYKAPLTWETLDAKVGEKLATDVLDLSCIFGYEEGDQCII